jgi:hypothetical protein
MPRSPCSQDTDQLEIVQGVIVDNGRDGNGRLSDELWQNV